MVEKVSGDIPLRLFGIHWGQTSGKSLFPYSHTCVLCACLFCQMWCFRLVTLALRRQRQMNLEFKVFPTPGSLKAA